MSGFFGKWKYLFWGNLQFYFMDDTISNFKVTDRQTFIKFLHLLHRAFLDNPENWENKALPDFIEALSAYTRDIQGYYR
ncbi:MAG: hypothetical protein EAZ08_04885 [Cytophagales bacterium]|nr:MAG: hypothetical protein EAZ08_04885 [Cytophagales bacterium]